MSGRTPKTGLLRQWVLLPERKKFVVVGVLAVACFLSLRSVFSPKAEQSFELRHSLTAGRTLCWKILGSTISALAPCPHSRDRCTTLCPPPYGAHACGADEKEALRLQIIREAEAEHEKELATLREQNLQAQSMLRCVARSPCIPPVLLLRPLATHHGASFKCRDLYSRAVAAGGHPCGSAAVWRAVVRVGICADDVVMVDVGVRERVCRGTNPTSPAPPPPSSHALHPHPAPCWMLSWPRRSRTRI